ncbi:hypothetical protein EV363DRAFT_1448604 [Boletus edulis]|nr:hypothetical protein EV363DRAFT_1448604 [Boletus edulis]
MAKTCDYCDGESSYGEVKLRRCAGCQKVYYCSTTCQKKGWIFHIFDCNPLQPINTAYYLARAVYRDLLPDHPQTCEDYGFNRAVTAEEKTMLFGLYVGLIKFHEIPPKTIHNWRVRGVLVDEIKAAFYKIPEHARGGYFTWFLQNEHIVALAGQPLSEEALHDRTDAILVRAWRFTGGSERDSVEAIRAAIARKSVEEQQCHTLYTLLLSMWHPAPYLDLWIHFGFASCISEQGEMALGGVYQQLIRKCSFKEFCDAYRGGRLLDLFRSNGLQVDDPHGHLRDLLHGPRGCRKSVWFLKRTIVQEDATEASSMERSVTVDYGFMNCRNDTERRQLKQVYKAFFDSHGDPLALHEAAIKGNLYGYLSTVVKGHKDPKFKRLMKNPYPLPDL